MEESPEPPSVINTNGYHNKPRTEPVLEIEAGVIRVQNGEVSRHGKGRELEENPIL